MNQPQHVETELRLPSSTEEITPEWIQHALSKSFPGIRLNAIRQGTVIHGSATKLRFELDHAPGSPGGPASVWVKIGFEAYSDVLFDTGIYATEAICYTNVLGSYQLAAPRCYFAQVQASPPQVAIILEDLGDYDVRFGRAIDPRPLDEVRAGLRALARIHAATWGQGDALANIGLKPALTWGEVHFLDQFIESADALFAAPRGYSVPLVLHDKARLAEAWARYRQMVLEGPQCLLHGDAHVGNSYVHPDGAVAFLDWQCATVGHWSHDVGYYLVSAADVPDRRAAEHGMIQDYLDELKAQGIDAPSFDEAWLAYRRSMVFAFLIWLGNPDTMQPEQIATACLMRAGAAMIDLSSYEALGV